MRLVKYLLLILWLPGIAQTKILFDASKAQMASNADWVVDADVNNLGLGLNGVMEEGQSNEANPQRFPTPAQAGINANTDETYWNGGLSAWAIDLAKMDYEIETLPYNGTVTYGDTSNPQDLSHYKVFISVEPNILFTATEKDALIRFVQNGGGLFMIGDHADSDRNFDGYDSPQIWNDLMDNNTIDLNPFGMVFDSAYFSQTSSRIASLPNDSCLHNTAIGDVTQVKISGGTSLTLNPADNASVQGLIYKYQSANSGNTQVLLATARYGNGKVAAFGDSSPPDDGTGDVNDVLYYSYTGEVNGSHRVMLLNTTLWLAATSKADTTTTGIASSAIEPYIQVWPNPTTGSVTITLPGVLTGKDIAVTDLSGKLLWSNTATMQRVEIPAGLLPEGIYIIRVGGISKKLVVVK
ncbi:MAG TPA: T9SS type A sorting domain-containing protein [Chitinophagales bacterium]|nr:T9SS type A sorting domain-containing protein [Chitinophagales bacterium]